MKKLEIFPTELYEGQEDISEYKEELIEYFMDFQKEHESVSVSNRKGYQSEPFLYDVPSFEKYSPIIWAILKPYFDQVVENIIDHGFSVHLTLSNLWVNINHPGSYNIEHTHPHSVYSGVLWIKSPEYSGNLVLQHPSKHNVYATTFTNYEIVPEEGKVVIFPSHVIHSVLPNESDEDRISLSFNICIS